MLLPNPLKKYRKRSHHKARPMAPTALQVLSVQVDIATPETLYLTLRFNTTESAPLNGVGDSSPAKWNARYGGKRYSGISLSLADWDGIQVGLEYTSDDAGANEVNYTNSPSDISDSLGRFLAAFSMAI